MHPNVIPGWAAATEKAGFASLGTVGRITYPGVMGTVAIAAAAGATSTIGPLSSVVLATTWPAPFFAKEVAGIDGVSGGRLTLGIGSGIRPDDFVAEGYGTKSRGKRFDRDLETYRQVWRRDPARRAGGPLPRQGPFLCPQADAREVFERIKAGGFDACNARAPKRSDVFRDFPAA